MLSSFCFCLDTFYFGKFVSSSTFGKALDHVTFGPLQICQTAFLCVCMFSLCTRFVICINWMENLRPVFQNLQARKALRALKGLVKLQALVRGYLVRKRTAATLHSMQALIRAQTAVRSQRARRSFNKENRLLPEIHSRKSIVRYPFPMSFFKG